MDSEKLLRVGQLISQTIDHEDTESSHRSSIAPGVSHELDELKRTYDSMSPLLEDVARQLRLEAPERARHCIAGCIFYPQLGFFTLVDLHPETGRCTYEGPGVAENVWQHSFTAENKAFFKNRQMRGLDKEYGDIYAEICGKPANCKWSPLANGEWIGKEVEIAHGLAVRVLRNEDALIAASEVCGELDCLVALAVGAERYRLQPPRMTEDNIIDIRGGRHPLQELVAPDFIANDCRLRGGVEREAPSDEVEQDCPSMIIVTGPNHSGKSVYLKQVALIVYMAHIGSYVPAESAVIGVTDRLLTRIVTRESVSRNESAFSIDLRQAAFSINFATRRSIVLIDEFGKGTKPLDGAALLTALLEYFDSLGPTRPKVLAATHFHEIFENNLLRESPSISFAQMETRVDLTARDPDDQVTFLYQLVPGRSTSSYGSRCAAVSGVDKAVIERAEAITLLLARGEDVTAACAKLSDQEMARLHVAEMVAREFLAVRIPEQVSRNRGAWEIRGLLRKVLEAGSISNGGRECSWGPFEA